MNVRVRFLVATLVVWLMCPTARGADDVAAEARASAGRLIQQFNAGNANQIAALFLADGEWIDENGVIYRGPKEIEEVLTAFFKKFPGAKLTLNIESVRQIGPIVIEEGTRTVTTKDGEARSEIRYVAVRTKSENGWKTASLRDSEESAPMSPREQLQGLAWLIGEWVNEGGDERVQVNYRWSDDKNYLLGEFVVMRGGAKQVSSQRIAWDPQAGGPRSWIFDADGSFSEGRWTQVEDGWVIKTSAVNANGEPATATITIAPRDNDHFSMRGTERIVGGGREPDFDLIITRRPPAARK